MNRFDKKLKITTDFRWGEFWSGDLKLGFKSIEPPEEYDNKVMDLATKLQIVRNYIGSPIIITSAYRTPDWNKHEGGSIKPLSYHVQGLAADIRVNGMQPYDLAIYVSKLTDFKGFGVNINKNFLHCDLRNSFQVFKY